MKNWCWTFEEQGRMRPSGGNLAEPNFTRESKNIVRLFKREFNQNAIDARRDDLTQPGKKKPAHVRVRIVDSASGLDLETLKEVFMPLEEHLKSAGHAADQRDWKNPRVLVIEEFDTLGLTGVTNDTYAKGEDERWANFWFGEGKRSKTGPLLGRQGQGKITYHIASGARAVIALTRRANEGKDYLFGKCIVQQSHNIGKQHFTHHGYWPHIGEDSQPLPDDSLASVAKIKKAFCLERTSESGTSWIIPFVPSVFTGDALLREFVGDFFFSILNGDLSADICGTVVNSGTLQSIISKLKIKEPSELFFSFLIDCLTRPETSYICATPGWENGDRVPDESFKAEELASMRQDFQFGKLVSVRLPIAAHPLNGDAIASFIDVHVQTGENIKHVEEIYVRSGLVIAEEQWLREQTNEAFGLVVAAERNIAEFLGYCEVASHLLWNAREKEANDRYHSVKDTLSVVRKSLPKIFRLLAGSTEAHVEDALDDILSVPLPAQKKKTVKSKKQTQKKPTKPRLEIFSHSDSSGEWRLTPGADASKVSYPREVTFRFAYDRLDGTGNAWNRWHPFDFDLSDDQFSPKTLKNVELLSRDGQSIRAKILSEKFKIAVAGFSKEQQLLIQLIGT